MTDLTHLFISGSHLWGVYNFGIMRYIQAYPKYFNKIKDFGGVSFGAMSMLWISDWSTHASAQRQCFHYGNDSIST